MLVRGEKARLAGCSGGHSWFCGLPRSSARPLLRPRRVKARPAARLRTRQGHCREAEACRADPRQARRRRHRRRPEPCRQAGHPRSTRSNPDVADLPDELEGVAVESIDHRQNRAPVPSDRPLPATRADRRLGRSGGRRHRHPRSTRHQRDERLRAFQQPRPRRGQHRQRRRSDHPAGRRRRRKRPGDRIATLAAYQTIDFNGGTNTMDAAIALTSTSNVGTGTPADGYGLPSPNTAQAFIGQAVQKYGRTTGLQPGQRRGDERVGRRLLHRLWGFLPPGGALCRADLHLARPFQRARRLRLARSSRKAETSRSGFSSRAVTA